MSGKTVFRKAVAFAGVSTLAIMVTGVAMAQQTANAPEEIIVTAQRRSERLQDVPVAISAATGAMLERSGITNVRDLSSMAPGLISTAGAGANVIPTIRGVGSSQTDPGNDPNVSLYVDGVYQPDELVNSMDIGDVSRIEVLKGPQGTLFGRNATGGAIRIFTKSPDLNTLKGDISASYGRYNQVTVDGFVTAPIVEGKLAASISGHFMRVDSYEYDLVRKKKNRPSEDKLVRLKLLAQPSDNLTLELFGSYLHHIDDDATGYTILNGNTVGRLFGSTVFPTKPYQTVSQDPITLKANMYDTGLRATLDTSIGQFTSLTAYNADKSFYSNEADFTEIDILSYPIWKKQHNFQQELTFASRKFGDFQFTGGVNYYSARSFYDPLVLQGIFISFGFGNSAVYEYSRQETDAYGVFGEFTWTPTDRLTILGGVRYSSEDRAAFLGAPFGYSPSPVRPTTFTPLGAPVTFGSTTPRASIRYRLTDEGDNVYFTYSHGFKSGGFNMSGVQAAPYKPEKLISYEIGLKSAPSRIVSANISAFYYDYTNQQVMAIINNTNFTGNAASSRVYGADADITARLTPEFTFTAGLAVLDAKYRNYTNVPGLTPTVLVPGVPCLCGNTTTTFPSLSGGVTPFSPKFTGSFTATYTKEFSMGVIDLSGTVYHSGRYDYVADTRVFQPAYTTLNLRASFQPEGTNFTIFAYGKNVTSTKYYVSQFGSNAGDAVRYARPATYGGGVKYEF